MRAISDLTRHSGQSDFADGLGGGDSMTGVVVSSPTIRPHMEDDATDPGTAHVRDLVDDLRPYPEEDMSAPSEVEDGTPTAAQRYVGALALHDEEDDLVLEEFETPTKEDILERLMEQIARVQREADVDGNLSPNLSGILRLTLIEQLERYPAVSKGLREVCLTALDQSEVFHSLCDSLVDNANDANRLREGVEDAIELLYSLERDPRMFAIGRLADRIREIDQTTADFSGRLGEDVTTVTSLAVEIGLKRMDARQEIDNKTDAAADAIHRFANAELERIGGILDEKAEKKTSAVNVPLRVLIPSVAVTGFAAAFLGAAVGSGDPSQTTGDIAPETVQTAEWEVSSLPFEATIRSRESDAKNSLIVDCGTATVDGKFGDIRLLADQKPAWMTADAVRKACEGRQEVLFSTWD